MCQWKPSREEYHFWENLGITSYQLSKLSALIILIINWIKKVLRMFKLFFLVCIKKLEISLSRLRKHSLHPLKLFNLNLVKETISRNRILNLSEILKNKSKSSWLISKEVTGEFNFKLPTNSEGWSSFILILSLEVQHLTYILSSWTWSLWLKIWDQV